MIDVSGSNKKQIEINTRFYRRLEDGELIMDPDKKDPLVYPVPPDSFPDKLNGKIPGIKKVFPRY